MDEQTRIALSIGAGLGLIAILFLVFGTHKKVLPPCCQVGTCKVCIDAPGTPLTECCPADTLKICTRKDCPVTPPCADGWTMVSLGNFTECVQCPAVCSQN